MGSHNMTHILSWLLHTDFRDDLQGEEAVKDDRFFLLSAA
jgi:hypothetical protein